MHNHIFRILICFCLGLATLGGPASAVGQDEELSASERAQALYLEGMSLYRSRRYRSAAARFEQAFRLFPDPRLMYNIGRSNEALGRLADAERWFLRCRSDPATSEALRAKAERRLQVVVQARDRSARAIEAPKAETVPVPSPSEARVTPASSAPTRVVAAEPESSWLGPSKWITGGVGLGLLGGGATLLALGLLDEGDLDDARTSDGSVSTLTRVEAAAIASDAEDKQLAGAIVAAAGGALLITSIVMFIVDAEDDDFQSGPMISIAPNAGGGAVQLQTSF